MGEQNIATDTSKQELRAFMRALLDDVHALESMIDAGMFEAQVRRIGAEQEVFLVDRAWRPARLAMELIERLADTRFTTELGLFNLEANLSPQRLQGDGLRRMEDELTELLQLMARAAQELGGNIVLTGILPTLLKEDLTLDSMTPSPRYRSLNAIMTGLSGGAFKTLIKGVDELALTHDNVMLEACNTSFQVHFQVAPEEFARLYNLAQAVTAPVLAAAVNSPVLLKHRLWHETRVALFQQSLDARSESQRERGGRTRVSFGDAWIRESVLEIYREDVARNRVLIADTLGESSRSVLARGGVPELKALRLHNGTVYRWNRACYGLVGDKPHLRIEHRVLPAGPSVVDQFANAAFFFGLMSALGEEFGDVTRVLEFDDAKGNFMAAARYGLKAKFNWIRGESFHAETLILDRLLPQAREGLRASEVDEECIDRYLGVLEERVRSGRTGAQWAFDSIAGMQGKGSRDSRYRALTAAMAARQRTGRPVHTWELATLAETEDPRESYRTVGQVMTTDVFTLHPEDLVDLAAGVMDWEHVRYVPVEDDDGRLVGLVSHRALLRLVARGRKDEDTVSVREIMRPDPITTTVDTTVPDAIRLMRLHKIGCLPVLREGRLVGIVTEHDFIEAAAKLLDEWLEKD